MVTKTAKRSRSAVRTAMHKMKKGLLRVGRSKKTVRRRKQAVAIGLSKARKKTVKARARKRVSKK